MTNLPPVGESSWDVTLIIIKVGEKFKLALKPVQSNALITFLGAGTKVPHFLPGTTNPLNYKSGNDFQVAATTTIGDYQFNMAEPNEMPQSYPYTIHVADVGLTEAVMVWTGKALKVKRTIPYKPKVKVKFAKGYYTSEYFDDAVDLTYGNTTVTIPDGQQNGLLFYDVTDPETITFHVGQHNSTSQVEVVGDDDADLEIEPDG